MDTAKPNFSEYNSYSLENLLREYLANPSNMAFVSKITQIIDSAESFQNGEFKSNDYITPSEAYGLIKNAINLENKNYSLSVLKDKFIKEVQGTTNLNFVENLLKVLTSSDFWDNNSTKLFFSKEKLC